MTRRARFELVHSDAGHHVRFRAANGRIIVSSEVYTTRRRALGAIRLLVRPMDCVLTTVGVRSLAYRHHTPIEIRDVDERGQS